MKTILLTIIFGCLSIFLIAQKVTIKDTDDHVLIEINDEDTSGSISILPGPVPSSVNHKLYNVGNSLYWRGTKLGTVINGGGWINEGPFLYPADLTDKVGIGTSNPISKLHLEEGTIQVNLGYLSESGISDYSVYSRNDYLTEGALARKSIQSVQNPIKFFYGVQGIAYDPTGAINIGVYGAADFGEKNWAGYFEGDVHMKDRLAIGMTNPDTTTKLHVAGNTIVDSTLQTQILYADFTDSSTAQMGVPIRAHNGNHTYAQLARKGLVLAGFEFHDAGYGIEGFAKDPGMAYNFGVVGQAEEGSNWNVGGSFLGHSNSSTTAFGVRSFGQSIGLAYGVFTQGRSTGAITAYGVYAEGNSNGTAYGVYGKAIGSIFGAQYGVYGESSGGGTEYGVYSAGDFGASGTKSAIVKTPDGPKKLYCLESTENWFEDFGSAEIVNGKSVVEVNKDYLETVTIDLSHPLKVFLTPNSPMGEWWVEKGMSNFIVHAPDADDGATFDFRIVAKRKGYENLRLEKAEELFSDKFLYPKITDVPEKYRAEWVLKHPIGQRDILWKKHMSAKEIELLYPE